MLRISRRVFICASLVFGVLGIMIVLSEPGRGGSSNISDTILIKGFMTSVLVILPSFALSVACKFLSDNKGIN